MRIFANIKPILKISGRISHSSHARQYTSLVQLLQRNRQCNNEFTSITNFFLRKLYNSVRSFEKANDQRIAFNDSDSQDATSILPVALIDLNPLVASSTKVLLIPLNWHDGNEMTIKNTTSSIFAKPKTIRQIENFSTSEKTGRISAVGEQTNLSLVPCQQTPSGSLPWIFGKVTQKFAAKTGNSAVLSKTLKRFRDVPTRFDNKSSQALDPYTGREDHNDKGPPLTTSMVMKMGALNINFDEFIWQSRFMYDPLSPIARNFSTMFMRDLNHKKDKCSLKSADYSSGSVIDQKIQPPSVVPKNGTSNDISEAKSMTSQYSPTTQHTTDCVSHSKSVGTAKFGSSLPQISSESASTKVTFNSPFVLELLGGQKLPMSCDIYRKAVIEANMRRSALKKSSEVKRPKDCTANCHLIIKNSKVPVTREFAGTSAKVTNANCKKDECPDLLKEEIERLRKLEKEECKKKDLCTKHKDGPNSRGECVEMTLRPLTPTIQSAKCDGNFQKDGVERIADGDKGNKIKPNPCKKDSGKSKKRSPCDDVESEYKPKCNTDPCDSESPQKQKPDPCKNPNNVESKKIENKTIDPCPKKDSNKNDKGETYPCSKDRKESDTKNTDTCKQDKKKTDSCSKKDSDAKKEENCTDQHKKQSADPSVTDRKITGRNKSGTCQKKKKDSRGKQENSHPCTQRKGPCAKDKKTRNAGTKTENDQEKNNADHCSQNKKKQEDNSNPCVNITKDTAKTRDSCSNQPKPTKPKCKPQGTSERKCFSTSAVCQTKRDTNNQVRNFYKWAISPSYNSPEVIQKRHYLRNMSIHKNFCGVVSMRHFSSKGKKSKDDMDHGIRSKCKSLALKTPPNRRKDQNPQTNDGLRICYPSYDMECPKKLCKNPRQTACSKYAFLKDTDNDKRKI